ncbi:hypothetical protein AAMO2058_001401400 [Amorphochlora amoebiformis]
MFSSEVKSFSDLKICQRLVDILEAELKHSRPTRIQAMVIPCLLQGKDVMFKSKTGSGKTLAFLLPLVHLLQGRRTRLARGDGTHAVIVAPTRELVLQIHHVLKAVLKPFYWLVSTTVMGGERRKSEKARLRKGATVVVATPGRLLDHLITTKSFNVNNLQVLVLDEADRLLDLGFENDINQILSILDQRQESKRQTILTSATLNPSVSRLIDSSLKNPERIGIQDGEEVEEEETLPRNLTQNYVKADSKYRLTVLSALLRSLGGGGGGVAGGKGARKVIVFVSTCDSVEFHYELFRHASWPLDLSKTIDGERQAFLTGPLFKLHGNIDQKDRTKTFFRFCNSSSGILFCTDVAARGLDLPAVDYIIQYDPPDDTSTYIHRVGRTARMGQRGKAVLFLQRGEIEYLNLLKAKRVSLSEISVVSVLAELNPDNVEEKDEEGGEEIPPGLQLQQQFETLVAGDIELHELARLTFLSTIRAYGAFPKAMKSIFHPRKLHLGMVAKSFGLKEPPKRLASGSTGKKKKGRGGKKKEEEGEIGGPGGRNPINRKKKERCYGDEMRRAGKTNPNPKKAFRKVDVTSEFAH